MANEQQPSPLDRFKNWVVENHAQQPALGAELRAMGREMMKDARGKLMETFFNSQEVSMEQGVPLSPTPQMVTNDLGTLGNVEDIFESYAKRGNVHGQEKDRGMGMDR